MDTQYRNDYSGESVIMKKKTASQNGNVDGGGLDLMAILPRIFVGIRTTETFTHDKQTFRIQCKKLQTADKYANLLTY